MSETQVEQSTLAVEFLKAHKGILKWGPHGWSERRDDAWLIMSRDVTRSFDETYLAPWLLKRLPGGFSVRAFKAVSLLASTCFSAVCGEDA